MKRPFELALDLAEEILNYRRYGLTKVDALHKLAGTVDENNSELVQAVVAVVGSSPLNGHRPDATALARLKEVLQDYQPHAVADSDGEGFFKNVSATPNLF